MPTDSRIDFKKLSTEERRLLHDERMKQLQDGQKEIPGGITSSIDKYNQKK